MVKMSSLVLFGGIGWLTIQLILSYSFKLLVVHVIIKCITLHIFHGRTIILKMVYSSVCLYLNIFTADVHRCSLDRFKLPAFLLFAFFSVNHGKKVCNKLPLSSSTPTSETHLYQLKFKLLSVLYYHHTASIFSFQLTNHFFPHRDVLALFCI